MLSLEEKIGQKLLVGFDGLMPPDYLLQWLAEGRVGGVLLFSRNIESPEQVAKMTQACHDAARYPILIGIDQEGGLVARLRDGFTESPGAMALGAAGSEALAYRVSKMLAVEMLSLGINWTLAPVVDVTHDINNPSVSTRSLGIDNQFVARFARAEIRGFQDGGVAASAKHFPGLGNTPVDTHDALAVINGSVDYLWENDLIPFRAAVEENVATVMTTHVKFEALDSSYPTTLSPTSIHRLLRKEMAYDGVVSTDCMEMKAITDHYQPRESAVLAANADVDLILFSHTHEFQEQAYDGLLDAAKSGKISQEVIDKSVDRITLLKRQYPAPKQTSTKIIRHPDHVALAHEAAKAGTVLLKSASIFPVDTANKTKYGMVEFAALMDAPALKSGKMSRFSRVFHKYAPEIEKVTIASFDVDFAAVERAKHIASAYDVLILVTRNAHIIQTQLDIALEIYKQAQRVILVCLRNPYDADVFTRAEAVLCTCGDGMPSLDAGVEALFGEFVPSGMLPVPVGAN